MQQPAAVLLAAIFSGAALAGAPEELSRGRILERVACAADSGQTYALYIPAAYARDRAWPILYVFDPSARGARGVALFQKGAETYGFLVAGSNNSQNGPVNVSLAAAQAMWRDTHQRFSIDDRRVFNAGFSGGSRVACYIGQTLSGSIAGVIGCGAGFPNELPPTRETRFAFFGLVGDADFNYRELRSLDATLDKLKISHGLEVFSGPHQWPTEPFCTDAIEWMRIHEMAAGIARDDALAAAILEKRQARAREKEAAGDILEAYRGYSAIARDFAALKDVSAAASRATEYEKDGRLKKLLAAEEKQANAERVAEQRLDETLEAARSSPQLPPLAAFLQQLRVEELKKTAKSADPLEAASAGRLLSSIFARTSFYLSQSAIEKKDYSRAVFFLSVAVEVRPENPFAWYNRACGWARAGNREKALADLRASLEKGFHDRTLLETDADLTSLRGDPGFQEILRQVPPASGAGPKP